MDTTNSLEVKRESFSTFNKNVFSFEAVEVESHFFVFCKSPAPSKMSENADGLAVAAQKIYTLRVQLSFKYKYTKCKLRR